MLHPVGTWLLTHDLDRGNLWSHSTSMKPHTLALPSVLLCLVFSTSCTKEKIRTYRVASDDAGTETSPNPPDNPTGAGSLRWQVPEGWTEATPGQFQTALYMLGGDVKVAVSNLPGEAGGEAANVNRWRQQVGLPAVEDVGGETLAVEGGGVSAKWFDLRGETESIMAAIISLPAETWFFKLNAPTAEVDTKREAFMSFLAGIHMESGAAPPAAPDAASVPDKPKIALDVPDGWVKSEGSTMRVASFAIPGTGIPDGDVSVIPLFGEAGSTLENVNRWRAQLRLPALESAQDPALGRNADGASGKMLITHMVSTENLFDGDRKGAISTAILEAGENTWFFKLAGEAELVAQNREKFEAFVLSAKIP
jgi:hypothetical protein